MEWLSKNALKTAICDCARKGTSVLVVLNTNATRLKTVTQVIEIILGMVDRGLISEFSFVDTIMGHKMTISSLEYSDITFVLLSDFQYSYFKSQLGYHYDLILVDRNIKIEQLTHFSEGAEENIEKLAKSSE